MDAMEFIGSYPLRGWAATVLANVHPRLNFSVGSLQVSPAQYRKVSLAFSSERYSIRAVEGGTAVTRSGGGAPFTVLPRSLWFKADVIVHEATHHLKWVDRSRVFCDDVDEEAACWIAQMLFRRLWRGSRSALMTLTSTQRRWSPLADRFADRVLASNVGIAFIAQDDPDYAELYRKLRENVRGLRPDPRGRRSCWASAP
jgi:hypothetical protein